MIDPSRLRGLYAVADTALLGKDLLPAVTEALNGGTRLLQYRDKSNLPEQRLRDTLALKELCESYSALLIINDDVGLALHCNADGVHLGRDDEAITTARSRLGAEKIIGASCYNSLDSAGLAIKQGADYIAFGSVFSSATKPEAVRAELSLFREANTRWNIPLAGIGGISLQNAAQLIDAGCDMIAVIRSLFGQNRIQSTTEEFVRLFEKHGA